VAQNQAASTRGKNCVGWLNSPRFLYRALASGDLLEQGGSSIAIISELAVVARVILTESSIWISTATPSLLTEL